MFQGNFDSIIIIKDHLLDLINGMINVMPGFYSISLNSNAIKIIESTRILPKLNVNSDNNINQI